MSLTLICTAKSLNFHHVKSEFEEQNMIDEKSNLYFRNCPLKLTTCIAYTPTSIVFSPYGYITSPINNSQQQVLTGFFFLFFLKRILEAHQILQQDVTLCVSRIKIICRLVVSSLQAELLRSTYRLRLCSCSASLMPQTACRKPLANPDTRIVLASRRVVLRLVDRIVSSIDFADQIQLETPLFQRQ